LRELRLADPDDERKLIEFCENGAKAVAFEATNKRYTRIFPKMEHCRTLTNQTTGWQQAGRITHPMVLRRGSTHYEPISWDEAFALTAAELNKLDSKRSALSHVRSRQQRSSLPSTSFSSVNSARITYQIVPTCATSRAVPRSPKPSASARNGDA